MIIRIIDFDIYEICKYGNSTTILLEVNFKSNLTLQNRLVRWDLHPTYIYYEIVLSLIDVWLPTPFSRRVIYISCVRLEMGGLIAAW